MKKLFLSLSLLAAVAFFSACSTDVNLYADYKDIPVVYGLLDASQDTNFIRINRAFSGSNDNPIDANEVALIADSCNYPGKLNAYIVEYRAGYGNQYLPTGDVVQLDTMTVQNKEEGIFYSPAQKVYFTDNRTIDGQNVFANNDANGKFRYKLFIVKGNDTITSETGLVGGENFKIITSQLSFASEQSDRWNKIKFTGADNAVFYDMRFVFHYRESVNGGPMVEKQVSYSFGAKSVDELTLEDGASYSVSYGENTLFNLLKAAIGGDTITNPNHPNVVRHFDPKPLEIFLAAGGDELYNYIQVNSQTGYSQTVPDYTNITGGYGVFSSRINLVKEVNLSSRAQMDLYGMDAWGFVQQ